MAQKIEADDVPQSKVQLKSTFTTDHEKQFIVNTTSFGNLTIPRIELIEDGKVYPVQYNESNGEFAIIAEGEDLPEDFNINDYRVYNYEELCKVANLDYMRYTAMNSIIDNTILLEEMRKSLAKRKIDLNDILVEIYDEYVNKYNNQILPQEPEELHIHDFQQKSTSNIGSKDVCTETTYECSICGETDVQTTQHNYVEDEDDFGNPAMRCSVCGRVQD